MNKLHCFQNRYSKHYQQVFCLDILLKQNLKNITELPFMKKILVTTTSKKQIVDKKNILPELSALEFVCGQNLKYTLAHKSIAGFKLRKNQLIGCKLTLRGEAMYRFLEKLITILLPRVRNYNGFQKSFFEKTATKATHFKYSLKNNKNHKADISLKKSGNYGVGIQNLLITPELENHFEYFEFNSGTTITFLNQTQNRKTDALLLSSFLFPIK